MTSRTQQRDRLIPGNGDIYRRLRKASPQQLHLIASGSQGSLLYLPNAFTEQEGRWEINNGVDDLFMNGFIC